MGVEWCAKDVTAADLMERKILEGVRCFHYVSDTWPGMENRVGILTPDMRQKILTMARSCGVPCMYCLHNLKPQAFFDGELP